MSKTYKIAKGTDLFNTLTDLVQKRNEYRKAMREFAAELGGYDFMLWEYSGKMAGINFHQQPEGWVHVDPGKKYQKLYRPKLSGLPKELRVKNREIDNRMKDLPGIGRCEFNNVLGYDSIFGGPGLHWGDEFILTNVPVGGLIGDYTPLPDMEEILYSEYERLNKEIEESEKGADQ